MIKRSSYEDECDFGDEIGITRKNNRRFKQLPEQFDKKKKREREHEHRSRDYDKRR